MLAMCSLLLPASSLLLAACGEDEQTTSDEPTTEVIVTPASARPGSMVAAAIRNEGDEELTYGAAYEIERSVDGSWEPVELPQRAVPEIGYVASPGGTGPPVAVELPDDLEPGTYRVVLSERYYGEFEVVDG
jgi:hypothetical protein